MFIIVVMILRGSMARVRPELSADSIYSHFLSFRSCNLAKTLKLAMLSNVVKGEGNADFAENVQ